MKKGILILVVSLLIIQTFGKVWIFVSFKINQQEIAKTLCVKKEVKNNSCQGKCQLKKQLAESEQEEQKQLPQTLKDKSEVTYCQLQQEYFFYSFIACTQTAIAFYHSDFYPSTLSADIFHPPQFNLI